MAGAHEAGDELEHAVHSYKGIALLIAILALSLDRGRARLGGHCLYGTCPFAPHSVHLF